MNHPIEVMENGSSLQDMTSRDLLQQRTTLPNGDTVWRPSPLVTAALEGSLAVLDGVHRINQGSFSVLHRWGSSSLILISARLIIDTHLASLSSTFLQTLPELVMPLKGHSLSPCELSLMLSAPSESFGY